MYAPLTHLCWYHVIQARLRPSPSSELDNGALPTMERRAKSTHGLARRWNSDIRQDSPDRQISRSSKIRQESLKVKSVENDSRVVRERRQSFQGCHQDAVDEEVSRPERVSVLLFRMKLYLVCV